MNVKPGDMAIQIMAHNKENIGLIVSVIKFDSGMQCWECTTYKAIQGYCMGILVTQEAGQPFFCPDEWLRPISGLPDTEETEEQQPIKEIA